MRQFGHITIYYPAAGSCTNCRQSGSSFFSTSDMKVSMRPTLQIIGPGLIDGSLLSEFLRTQKYRLAVMARSADQIAVLSKLGVKTIQTSIQDLGAIGSVVKAHDVLVPSGPTSSPRLNAVYLIRSRSTPRARTTSTSPARRSKPSYAAPRILSPWALNCALTPVVLSASVFGHRYSPHNPIDTVYDDTDPEIINSVSSTAPHRAVDLAW
ncbi:hypothetical protein B0H17DRAFT_1045597 [Mycena rosella]|uniref:Uncharacterized protein n=1 Tax=Mycena rosella TaxID=1033263 RepID=A0AAD7GPM0_MYCRO|nr:hypothetical protein B0H17DRAFT_1045597 [Mycena rosella]